MAAFKAPYPVGNILVVSGLYPAVPVALVPKTEPPPSRHPHVGDHNSVWTLLSDQGEDLFPTAGRVYCKLG
jgi:hypothetical protein